MVKPEENKFQGWKKKQKSKQIALEYRDEETNELVRMLIDKARKVRVTPLKKAILQKRQRMLVERQNRKDEKRLLKEAVDKVKESEINEDGFVTIDDEGDAEDSQVDDSEGEKEMPETRVKGGAIPYSRIFDDLDKIFEDVSQDLSRSTFSDTVKTAQKAVDQNQPIVRDPERKRGKNRKVREYVDICQDDPEQLDKLEDLVVSLVLKLK